MKENVSGCFFLNTVVLICYLSCRYLFILSVCSAGVCLRCLLSVSVPFCYYWLLIYYKISYGRPACRAVGFSGSPLPCSFTVVFLLYIVYWRWQINMMMMIHVSASKQAPPHIVRGGAAVNDDVSQSVCRQHRRLTSIRHRAPLYRDTTIYY